MKVSLSPPGIGPLLMILALTGACGVEASPSPSDPGLAAAPALVAADIPVLDPKIRIDGALVPYFG